MISLAWRFHTEMIQAHTHLTIIHRNMTFYYLQPSVSNLHCTVYSCVFALKAAGIVL